MPFDLDRRALATRRGILGQTLIATGGAFRRGMKGKPMRTLLSNLGACSEAVKWVGDRTIQQAWDDCDRADWMLWLLGEMEGADGWPDRRQLVLMACDCAETAMQYVSKGEDRPRLAIEAARGWCDGTISIEDVLEAARSARAAESAARSAWSAESEAWSSARSAAASAASAESAARSAWSAESEARSAALKRMAKIIRTRRPILVDETD